VYLLSDAMEAEGRNWKTPAALMPDAEKPIEISRFWRKGWDRNYFLYFKGLTRRSGTTSSKKVHWDQGFSGGVENTLTFPAHLSITDRTMTLRRACLTYAAASFTPARC
jgi:hypothetical protein